MTANTFGTLKALFKARYAGKAHPKDCSCSTCKKK